MNASGSALTKRSRGRVHGNSLGLQPMLTRPLNLLPVQQTVWAELRATQTIMKLKKHDALTILVHRGREWGYSRGQARPRDLREGYQANQV